ncbi:MoaD/ThiS family protein [Gottschalkiaceae bacterium SANA]|nr:MoaD/ThiS family protein [Gottschalkiaceae bacterium SANA]
MIKIEVRLFATFRNGRGKKVFVEMDQPTVEDVLQSINITNEEVAILLVNGQDGHFDQVLIEGDYLSIFPPVGGG